MFFFLYNVPEKKASLFPRLFVSKGSDAADEDWSFREKGSR